MDLNDYQREANRTDQRPGDENEALVFPLVGLASEVGSLVNQYKKRVRDGEAHAFFSDRAAEELGDVMWYVANLAEKLGLTLEGIAELNLRRIQERWPLPGQDEPVRLLDDDWPETEQLPRETSVLFTEVHETDHVMVRLTSDGMELGDPLLDMAYDPDGYRFHDAFHLAYAAMLGWSPLTRTLFGRQRRSNPRVCEVEDSGRAKVIEEGIAAFVFDYARQENFLEGVKHLDFSLLQTIISLVEFLEVRGRTARDWERAILSSFEVWRSLKAAGGGTLHLDLPRRRIAFEPPR